MPFCRGASEFLLEITNPQIKKFELTPYVLVSKRFVLKTLHTNMRGQWSFHSAALSLRKPNSPSVEADTLPGNAGQSMIVHYGLGGD